MGDLARAHPRAHPCAVCGAPAAAREMTAPGSPRWLCRDHMAPEAVEVLDEIEELRRKAEPTRQ